MNERTFFSELKRRNVYKVAVAYAVIAWLIIQAASIFFPAFNAPQWAMQIVILILVVGFPIALIFSWAFEITPEGIVRESEIDRTKAITRKTGRKIVAITVIIAVIATGLFVYRMVGKDPRAIRIGDAEIGGSPSMASLAEKSIAVLPFENLSSDKENAYFAEGIQDEILTRLSKIADLKVISRTSTQQFKSAPKNLPQIAKQLGVMNVVEGSVQRARDQVRVNVQLINALTDAHLWADTYDRKLTDIFAVESEIAKAIADALQAKLSGSEQHAIAARPTENAEAHKLYLQGNYYNSRGTEADYRKAIEYYKGAVKLDPYYALAYSDLSTSLVNLARKFLSGAEAQQTYVEARAAIDMALSLEPELATAHITRGFVLESADFKWTEAAAEYERAMQLAPNDDGVKAQFASSLATLGHPGQAVELARQELASDPLCASCYNRLSLYLASLGRLDDAEQAIRRAIDLQPGHADFFTQLAMVAILRGDAKAALEAAQHEVAAGGWQEIALALAQQISGDTAAADLALKNLIDHQALGGAYQIAQVYALRKDPDNVFEWLDRAWANRDPGLSQLLYDPLLLRYKDDSRFAPYCQKIGLPPPIIGAKATLRQLLPIPAGVCVSVQRLKIDPIWDPIRSNPGFQQLLTMKEHVGP